MKTDFTFFSKELMMIRILKNLNKIALVLFVTVFGIGCSENQLNKTGGWIKQKTGMKSDQESNEHIPSQTAKEFKTSKLEKPANSKPEEAEMANRNSNVDDLDPFQRTANESNSQETTPIPIDEQWDLLLSKSYPQMEIGDFAEALSTLSQAERLAESLRSESVSFLATTYTAKADVYLCMRKPSQAIENLELAIKLVDQDADGQSLKASALIQLGEIHAEANDAEKAMVVLDAAIEIIEPFGPKKKHLLHDYISALKLLANIAQSYEDYSAAKTIYDKTLAVQKEYDDNPNARIETNCFIAMTCYQLGLTEEVDQTISVIKQMLKNDSLREQYIDLANEVVDFCSAGSAEQETVEPIENTQQGDKESARKIVESWTVDNFDYAKANKLGLDHNLIYTLNSNSVEFKMYSALERANRETYKKLKYINSKGTAIGAVFPQGPIVTRDTHNGQTADQCEMRFNIAKRTLLQMLKD